MDALLLAPSQRDWAWLESLQKQKTPLILVDRRPDEAKVNFVGVNDDEIGYMATEHLIRRAGDQYGARTPAGISESAAKGGAHLQPGIRDQPGTRR